MQHHIIPCPEHPDAYLEACLLTDDLHYGQTKKRPAVIVCPGGGYAYCCPREGEPVALAYSAQGFHSFVLHYSVGWNAAGFAPLDEISWAIGLLREMTDEWNVLVDQIAVCGFSAGGHLALASGLMAENKPNAMILGYPAASAPNQPGADFMLKLLMGKTDVTDEDAVRFDLVKKITQDAPPVFIAATAEDSLTQFGALPIANAYSRLQLLYELHIFQNGAHGYSLATEAAADGSSRQLDESFAYWHELSVLWLKRIWERPVYEDKSVGKMWQKLKELSL